MYAIIETGGKQYKVSEGDKVYVESLGTEEEKKVTFDKVLAYSDGKKLTVGKPLLKDIKVSGKVVKNGKGKKIIVFKFKAKKGYKKTQGHRQPYTCVEITEVQKAEKKAATEKTATKKVAPKKTTTTKKAAAKTTTKKAAPKKTTTTKKAAAKTTTKKAAPKKTTAKKNADDKK